MERGWEKSRLFDLQRALTADFYGRDVATSENGCQLFWILQNGSPGTDMTSFPPLVLTEEEAWMLLSMRDLSADDDPYAAPSLMQWSNL